MSEEAPQFAATQYSGPLELDYRPDLDGDPDPGEVVWAWVPYEEDNTRGKDRPLIVVGRTPASASATAGYVGLMLSSRDHSADTGWVLLGSGSWDSEGRSSWVKVDRLLLLRDGGIRREGAIVDRERFLQLLDKIGRELRGEQVD
jgi:hypothetical protein